MKCFALNNHKRVRGQLAVRPPDRLSTEWEIRCRYANYFKLSVLLKSLARLGVSYGLSIVAVDCTPPTVVRQCQTGNSPLEGGEGRQALGDVPVGECRLGCLRDIPPGTEAVPAPFEGGIVPRQAAAAVWD